MNRTIREHPAKIRLGDLFHMPAISKAYVFPCIFEQCHPAIHSSNTSPTPRQGLPSQTWVEVMRTMYDPLDMGYWMYLFPGSGYHFHLGRTLAFATHGAALRSLCPTRRDCTYTNAFNKTITSPEARIAARANELGYDSVQFTRFVEHGMLKAEVLFVKLNTANGLAAHRCHKYRSRFDPPTLQCGGWPAIGKDQIP